MLARVLKLVETTDESLKEIRGDILCMNKKIDFHSIAIKQIELLGQMSITLSQCHKETLPSITV